MSGIISFLKAVKKIKTQLSAGKIMESVFCDSERVIHVDFLSHGVTVNAQYYNSLLCNNMHQEIWKEISGNLPKIIPLHVNACPHTANLTQATLKAMGWEIMKHPPYSPD
jgi:histone-lysine N-methyltransferase SETMAR